MSFDPSISPLLTPINIATTESYGLPFSSNVVGNPIYNTAVSWGGPGGTLSIITTGNLASVAQLSTAGFLAIKTPGAGVITAAITAGTGIGVTPVGDDYQLSVLDNTTTQRVLGQYNNTAFGSAGNTINLIAGPNIGISASESSGVLSWTIQAGAAASTSSPFVITQASSALTGATNLGGMSTGYVFSTVSAGVSTLSTVSASAFATLSGTQTFSGVNTFTQPPVMSGASILPGTVAVTAISGTALTLSGAQTVTGIKTFTPQQVFTNSIKIPLAATAGYVLTSDSAGVASWLPGIAPLAATVTTTNATATSIITVALAQLACVTVSGTIAGAKSDYTDACGGTFSITAMRASGGNITLVSPASVIASTTSTATFNASVNTSSQSVIISVTGIASTTYNWSAKYSLNNA
jgi:hypothetical protein